VWVGSGFFLDQTVSGSAGCAQVAERLMAADCKSAAPWSYGGSNPPLCTMDWKHGCIRGTTGRAEVDRFGLVAGALRFGCKNHRPGQGALGGIAVVGFFRVADRADRVRFAIAWDCRSRGFLADVAQSVEHSLGKGEVTGSIPVISSRIVGVCWAEQELTSNCFGFLGDARE
jgi:hypothetical protein